jgi:TolB protein
MNEQRPLPMGLSIGVIIIFVSMLLGVCFLIVFLYNLPVIFPPPASNPRVVGIATVAPNSPSPRPSATITPIISGLGNTPSPTAPPASPTPGGAASPGPVVPPAGGRIVFVTERNGFNSIFIMNADGSAQRPLVPHNGNYYDYAPAVSPDGQRLAFSSNHEKPGTDNIYLMNMGGTNLVKITSTPNAKNASSSWFPDGRRLAFASNRSGRWQPYTMNDDGTGVRQLITSNDDVINVAVSPDGGALAYTCGREICLANGDGSSPRVLLKNGLAKDHLAWSPDSSLLAFKQANLNSAKTSVYVLDLQGNNRLIADNGGWPSWSPDGRNIVYSSDLGGVANLYMQNLDTGQVRQLTRTQAADYTPVWTRQ